MMRRTSSTKLGTFCRRLSKGADGRADEATWADGPMNRDGPPRSIWKAAPEMRLAEGRLYRSLCCCQAHFQGRVSTDLDPFERARARPRSTVLPYRRIQNGAWDRYAATGVILSLEPAGSNRTLRRAGWTARAPGTSLTMRTSTSLSTVG